MESEWKVERKCGHFKTRCKERGRELKSFPNGLIGLERRKLFLLRVIQEYNISRISFLYCNLFCAAVFLLLKHFSNVLSKVIFTPMTTRKGSLLQCIRLRVLTEP